MEWWIEEERWLPTRLKFYDESGYDFFIFTDVKLNSRLTPRDFREPKYPRNTEEEIRG